MQGSNGRLALCYSWLRATGFYFIRNFGEVGCLATSKSSPWSKNLQPSAINNIMQLPHCCLTICASSCLIRSPLVRNEYRRWSLELRQAQSPLAPRTKNMTTMSPFHLLEVSPHQDLENFAFLLSAPITCTSKVDHRDTWVTRDRNRLL